MIVVTGGAGFIGSAFVAKLNDEGIDDIIVVDELGTSEKWKNLVKRRYADYLHKDAFLGMVEADRVPFPVEAVVHMGACSSTTERDADYLMENNLPLLLPPGRVGPAARTSGSSTRAPRRPTATARRASPTTMK